MNPSCSRRGTIGRKEGRKEGATKTRGARVPMGNAKLCAQSSAEDTVRVVVAAVREIVALVEGQGARKNGNLSRSLFTSSRRSTIIARRARKASFLSVIRS